MKTTEQKLTFIKRAKTNNNKEIKEIECTIGKLQREIEVLLSEIEELNKKERELLYQY